MRAKARISRRDSMARAALSCVVLAAMSAPVACTGKSDGTRTEIATASADDPPIGRNADLEERLRVSVRFKDGRTCVTMNDETTGMSETCNSALLDVLEREFVGSTDGPTGLYWSLWLMDEGSQALGFEPGPQAPSLQASAGDGYLLVGLLPSEFVFELWHVTVRLPDGALTRCVVQFGGNMQCGPSVPGDLYPHPTG